MGLNLTCPQCGSRMTMDFATSKVMCQKCGYVRPDEIGQMDVKARDVKSQGQRPHVDITHRGEVNPAALAAFETGHDLLFKGDKAGAMQSFLRAADFQPDFVDAHLWIAKISDDPKVKRDHLDSVLVIDSTHLEALRMLMVLNGRLTPEQATQTYHDNDTRVQRAEGEVAAQTTALLCPNCGGDLTVNEEKGRVECRFCGYSAPQKIEQASGGDVLAMALLERRAKAVQWNVGKRVIKCQQCGAQHTIPGERMSQRCRFCGSNEVIVNDALNSFDQPDGLIPFSVAQDDAQEQIQKQLGSLAERFVNLFNANKVERTAIDGVYLPYWVFDVTAEVTETHTVGFNSTSTRGMQMESDVVVPAIKSPPTELAARIAPFDLARMLPYESTWLAKYPAQLYSIDFDKASLEARAIASKTLKMQNETKVVAQQHLHRNDPRERPEIIQIISQIQGMSFRLCLMPVWIATLYEEDGEVRIGVVNGQTGKVALGRAHKLERKQ